MYRVAMSLELVLFLVTAATAADQQGQKQQGTIKAVQQDTKSLTVTDQTGQNEQTYQVPQACTILVDGQQATFSSLKPGYFVKFTLNDQKQTTSIWATSKQPQ